MSDAEWWKTNGLHVRRAKLEDDVADAERQLTLARMRLSDFDKLEVDRMRAVRHLHELFARDWAPRLSANELRKLEGLTEGR